MTRLPWVLGLVGVGQLPAAARAQSMPRDTVAVAVSRIRDSVIELTDGRVWQPGFYRAAYLGRLPPSGGPPLLVFVAYPCSGRCINGPFLYVLRPGARLSDALFVGQPPGVQFVIGRRGPWGHTRVLLGSCVTPDTQLISLWHHDTNPPTVDSLTIVSQHGRLPWVSAAPLTPELRDSIRQAVGTKRCRELTL